MQRDHTAEITDILLHPAFKKAIETLDIEHERTVADIITLTEIPSPPFKEDKRAAAYLDMLRTHGLDDVERDEIGNVMGVRRGTGNGALTVVAAHLDTVFPEGTDVTVRREGTKHYAPGVGDDTADGGWSHSVYTVSPGIPGDSGSGLLDAKGHAIGVLSDATSLEKAFLVWPVVIVIAGVIWLYAAKRV